MDFLLKKWGYVLLSFRNSVIQLFPNSVTHILLNIFNVCGPTSMKLIPHVVPEKQEVW